MGASLNHIYRLVWNRRLNAFVPAAENARRQSANAGVVSSIAAVLAISSASMVCAADLPTQGQVVAGSGSISQNGTTMTVTQATAKMAVNWQSFDIGQGHTVNFVQPSTSAVALNRVIGSDVSTIQGALTANGQVFLVNPNGVLFSPSAQVNVGGLVASTLDVSNEDFMAGNYRFSGDSRNSVVNQGNIAANDGTVALVAARVINDGSITANGGNVLLGAGSSVTLDIGGPVKLQVERAAIDALVENGGAIKADGGTIYLTAKAAGDLAATVIRNTGVIEAQTLASGESGEIYLLGDMQNDRIEVGGRLDASAPTAGNGGFIDTSAAEVKLAEGLQVTTLAAGGDTGTWLIDPATWTVAASGGDETAAALAARLASSNITIQADNAIYINEATSWSANKLTLSSGDDIFINATLNATNTASLGLEYGQGTADGAGSTYTVANGAKIYVPDGGSFTWKKGSAGATRNLVFDNGNLRFGNGSEASINADGQLKQPWYFDDVTAGRNGWFKLTYSSYPLDIAVASGGDGSSAWNTSGEVLSTNDGSYNNTFSPAITNRFLDISGYKEGTGTIVSTATLTFSGTSQQLKVENIYELAPEASFLKTDTVLTNLSGSAMSNVRLWLGTRDDWVAVSDANYKFKGNLTANGFESIATQDEQAKAIKITENDDGVTGAAVLFYSTTAGADTVTDSCCQFANVTDKDPRTSDITTPRQDGSYALFMRMPDLAAGASDSMRWYYAAAPVSRINDVVTQVGESAGVTPPRVTPPSPPPTPATGERPAVEFVHALTNPENNPGTQASRPVFSQLAAGPSVASQSNNGGATPNAIGSLGVVEIKQEASDAETGGEAAGDDIFMQAAAQADATGLLNVFVINGGVRIDEETN